MNTSPARPKLTGITMEDGQCDRCNRELGRVFEVRHPDGQVNTYGRRCCAKVTGYTNLDAQLRMARRTAVMDTRRAKVAAAFPGLDSLTVAQDTELSAILTNDRFWDGEDEDGHGRGWSRWATWGEAIKAVVLG